MPSVETPPPAGKNFLETAYDFWKQKGKEALEFFLGKERPELDKLKKEVEKRRENIITKEGMDFELWQGEAKPSAFEEDISKYHLNIDFGEDGMDKVKGVKTAAQMAEDLPKEERDWMQPFILAESEQESSDTYNVLGREIGNRDSTHYGTSALGRYQIMPKNWIAWSKETFDGKIVAPTPQAQEYMAFKRFKLMFDEAKKAIPQGKKTHEKYFYDIFYSMACVWYSGHYTDINIKRFKWNIVLAPTGEIDAYAQSILQKMGLKRDALKAAGSKAVGIYNRVKHRKSRKSKTE